MTIQRNPWLILFVISLIYHFSLLYANINVYDEGIVLTGAERVKNGDVPYLDFWTIYPPGQYYVLGGIFKVFGSSVLVERIYDLLIRCFLSLMPFLISRRLGCNNWASLTGWMLATVYLGSFTFFSYPVYPALLLISMGFYSFLKTGPHPIRSLFVTGIWTGLAALFRHDLAFFAFLCFGLGIVVHYWRKWLVLRRGSFAFLGGTLLITIPCGLFFLDQVGFRLLFDHLVSTPAEVMPRFRALPYPSPFHLETLQFYIFPALLFGGVVATLFVIFRFKVRNRSLYGLVILLLTGILVLNQVRVRSDMIHLLPAVFFSILALPALFKLVLLPLSRLMVGGRFFYVFACLVVVLPFLIPLYKKYVQFEFRHFTMTTGWSPIPKSGVSWIPDDVVEVIEYVQELTAKGEPIYIGTQNHDQFVISDVAAYFLADRPPGTRYHELHPGVASTEIVQEEIIRDLKYNRVKVVVLAPRFWEEPNESRFDTRTEVLDHYIRTYYEADSTIGIYEVWVKDMGLSLPS